MPDLERRLSEGRRAVATMDPPADLWERVVERSDHGDAIMLNWTTAPHRRRRSLWVAVAAAAVLLALVGSLTLFDDDVQTVDTVDTEPQVTEATPVTVVPQVPAPPTIVSGVGCPFGVRGEPIVMNPGPVDPLSPRFNAEGGQGIAHAVLGSQVAEVRVPGFEVDNTDRRWRIEDFELERGTARLWLNGPPSGLRGLPFVQVGWFPDTGEPCDSFAVTVDGGSVDANRRTAIDLAERIVLPGELVALDLPGAEGGPVAGLELAGTEWEIAWASMGPGYDVGVSFSDTAVTWDNGCATVSADYELDRDDGILTLSNRTSTSPGCTPPTDPEYTLPWRAIGRVMGAERIPVRYILDRPPGSSDVPVTGLFRLGGEESSNSSNYLLLQPA